MINEILPEERIRTMSGVSKRLFVALSDFRANPPQLEDALFQLASVIDSTSKYYFPTRRVVDRFTAYLDSIMTDVFRIASSGHFVLEDCTFLARDGRQRTFGEIMYGIRCSSYHDPEEVDDLIHWGDDNQIGTKDGRFIVSQKLLMGLFLMLISDEANKDRIDRQLFNDNHFLITNGMNYPFYQFVGNRSRVFEVIGI